MNATTKTAAETAPFVTIAKDGPSRLLQHWGRGGDRVASCKRFARKHGNAGYMMASGGYRAFWLESCGRLRQRTWERCRPLVKGSLA